MEGKNTGNGSKCSVKDCPNSFYSSSRTLEKIRFFRFPNPKDTERVLQWKLACNDGDIMKKEAKTLYSNNRICSIHFENKFIINHNLNRTAVPTLNLLQKSMVDKDTQTEVTIKLDQQTQTFLSTASGCQTQTPNSLSSQTPRKSKLRDLVKSKSIELKKIEIEKAKLERSLEETIMKEGTISKELFKRACDRHLPRVFGNTAKIVSELKDRKPKSRRYTKKFKQHALSLFYSGPKAYRQMATNYNFPSVATLRRMTENVQKKPGLNDFVFRSLKWRLQEKSGLEKICILSMDEVSLKAGIQYDPRSDEIIGFHDLGKGKDFIPAKNALVLMARGIHDNWKQPLGYFFLSSTCGASDLKPIFFDCITKMMETGLDEKLKEIPFVHPCAEFPYVYLLQLFIRMRIFYIAKYANRNFKRDETNNRRAKKLRKLQILQHK